jgi:hypothetical protein
LQKKIQTGGKGMLQMATISKILKEHFVNGKSPHQISQEFEVSWATVNGYLKKKPEDFKNLGKRPKRTSTVGNEKVKEEIRRLLTFEVENKIHKKQKYTPCLRCNVRNNEANFIAPSIGPHYIIRNNFHRLIGRQDSLNGFDAFARASKNKIMLLEDLYGFITHSDNPLGWQARFCFEDGLIRARANHFHRHRKRGN